jgi:UDP-N-acetylmuramoyl-tripeptide--D-alanyl-D-alanine ligase
VKSGDVAKAMRATSVSGVRGEIAYERIAVDSRRAGPGDLFVALRGNNTDGHLFIDDAVSRGARGVVCERDTGLPAGTQVFLVDDSLAALSRLAGWKRNSFEGKVIAITGSNGKTTTKEMAGSVLSRSYAVRKSEENMNTMIGLSITLFGLREDHDILLVEMGTNHPGEIAEMTGLVRPHVGVITNVSTTHLAHFGSVQAVLEEKGALLAALPADGRALVNGDDRRLRGFARALRVPVWTFGRGKTNDHFPRDLRFDEAGRPSFGIDGGIRVALPVPGLHNVSNAMAAVAIGNHFRVPPETIAQGLLTAELPRMRGEFLEQNGIRFLVDCYNANPASMKMSLRTLSGMRAGRRIAVLGAMAELGRRGRAFHRQVGEEAARCGIDLLVTVGRDAEAYGEGATRWAKRRRKRPPRCITAENISECARTLSGLMQRGDIVLFKASRTVRLEELVRMMRKTD